MLRSAAVLLPLCWLGAAGCLRIGYHDVPVAGHGGRDAGTSMDAGGADAAAAQGGDAGADAAGGSGGAAARAASGGGGAGASGVMAAGGSSAAGSGGKPASGGAPSAGSDASAGAGGMTDAGTPDAGTDAAMPDTSGAHNCVEHPEALECNGFEDPGLTGWTYKINMLPATATRVTDRYHSGSASVHIVTNKASKDSQARYAYSVLGSQTSSDIWLRYYDYLPSTVTLNTHFSSGVISSLSGAYEGFWLQVFENRVDIGYWNGTFTGSAGYPRDRWVCVELHVAVDGVNGRLEAYLDGALTVSSGPLDTIAAGGYDVAEVGLHYTEPTQGPLELWVDDAIVSRVRVPCN